MNASKEQAIRILRSWHMVEFFQPYNIPENSNSQSDHIKLTLGELQRLLARRSPKPLTLRNIYRRTETSSSLVTPSTQIQTILGCRLPYQGGFARG